MYNNVSSTRKVVIPGMSCHLQSEQASRPTPYTQLVLNEYSATGVGSGQVTDIGELG